MLRKFLILLFLSLTCTLYGQQLTRFAVVDMPKVYTAFFRDSAAIRQFEERSARVQNEVQRRERELLDLRGRRAEAELQGNQSEVNRLDVQIYRMAEALNDYYQTQTAILEDQRRRLTQSGSFFNQIQDEIRFIAESEGYSMVLSLSDNTGIIWYSPTVDITDKLIANLQTRAGRN